MKILIQFIVRHFHALSTDTKTLLLIILIHLALTLAAIIFI